MKRLVNVGTDKVQCVVIGAGVVGLACAKKFSELGVETMILEKAAVIGSGNSSRNSEVIHAGIYYAPGSLKQQLCIGGKEKLYKYIDDRKIPFNKCGKLIVASSESELPLLYGLKDRGQSIGVDLRIIESTDVSIMEPNVSCVKALYSPTTGIFDSHSYMQNLQGDSEKAGAVIVYNCEVHGGFCGDENYDTYNGENADRNHTKYSSKNEINDVVKNEQITLDTSQGLIIYTYINAYK
jgi:L-2-hydroxyglutarate oxidase LhgO